MGDFQEVIEYAMKGIWAIVVGWLVKERRKDLQDVADRPTKEDMKAQIEKEVKASSDVTKVHLDNIQEDIKEIKSDIKDITRRHK